MFTVSIVTASHVEMSFDFGPNLRHALEVHILALLLIYIYIETPCFTKEETCDRSVDTGIWNTRSESKTWKKVQVIDSTEGIVL